MTYTVSNKTEHPCCNGSSVVNADGGAICECYDEVDANKIADALNAAEKDRNSFTHGIIVALGCIWLGFGDGPGTPVYDEILNSAGRDAVLERAAKLDPEDLEHSGLAPLMPEHIASAEGGAE